MGSFMPLLNFSLLIPSIFFKFLSQGIPYLDEALIGRTWLASPASGHHRSQQLHVLLTPIVQPGIWALAQESPKLLFRGID